MAAQPGTSLYRPVNESTRAAARNLLRVARDGGLALIDAETGAPSIARVGLATDTNGMPVFLVSSLSKRSDDLQDDPRVALLVGESGGGDPLEYGRMSLRGDVRQLSGPDCDRARRRYLAAHPHAAAYIDFDDMSLWRLDIESASYIAGFGQAHTLTRKDLETHFDDWSGWNGMEARAVEHMNADHSDATRLYATVLCGAADKDWQITGLDPDGIDMAADGVRCRYAYPERLQAVRDLRPKLVELAMTARQTHQNDED